MKRFHGWIPQHRQVTDHGIQHFPEGLLSHKLNTSTPAPLALHNDEPPSLEIRDEALRNPWISFFNEYEYRYPSKHFTSTSETRLFSWFKPSGPTSTPEETRLVFKLDILIVCFAVISYWAKYVDQANLANAYVSGMKEDLKMDGNEYADAVAAYNAGTVIFQAVYMYLFPRVSMHWMFAIGDITWSVITVLCGFVGNSRELMYARFATGAAEAGYFMMMHYLLGCWYKPDELGKRGGLYYCGSMLGVLTAGLLQAWIFEHFDGVGGRAGWRWAFIVDGLITLPVGLMAFYMVPGTPYNCYSLFLSDDEIRLSRKRLSDANIKMPSKQPPPFFDATLWKRVLGSWKIYVLSVLNSLFWNSTNINAGGFVLWLKSMDYTVPQINRLSAIPALLGIPLILIVTFSADVLHSRSGAIFFAEAVNLSAQLSLAIWDVPQWLKWYSFLVQYVGITISSVVYGWLNDIMRHDAQERAIVLCWCNLFAGQLSAVMGRWAFPTSEGPRFHKGYTFTVCAVFGLMVWVWVTLWCYKRQERTMAKENGILVFDSRETRALLDYR